MMAMPETFTEELARFRRGLLRYNIKWHLMTFPKDLVRQWYCVDGALPWPTSGLAYRDWKTGRKCSRLFKGPTHFPQLHVIEGGLKEQSYG